MKKGGVLFLILFWLCPALGQTEIATLFQKDNPNIILQNEARSFDGNPLIYLEGVSDKPQPKTWQDKLKMRLFGSMEIPKNDKAPELTLDSSILPNEDNNIEIQPSFGQKKKVPFIPHTADWKFVITLTDSNLINVYENMTFILTEPKELTRDWPVSGKNFHLIKAEIDHKPVSIQSDNEASFLKLDKLTPGAHTLHLNYTINQPQNQSGFVLPLIGAKWSLLADRFSGVLFTNQSNIELPTFLIGENQQKFPENFTTQKDNKGNIFFKMDKILPPRTQIHLALSHQTTNEFGETSFIFWIALGVIIFYTILACLEIKYMSLEKRLKRLHRTSLNPIKNFIYRSGEFCIGILLLLILTGIISCLSGNYLTWNLVQILILNGLLAIVLMDYFFFHPAQREVFQMKAHSQKEIQ